MPFDHAPGAHRCAFNTRYPMQFLRLSPQAIAARYDPRMRGRGKARSNIARAFGFLALGAIINIAMAWTLSAINRPLPIAIALSNDEAAALMPVRRAVPNAPLIEVTGSRAAAFGRARDTL